ncbi:RIP metalloprotease RseP [bacterium]|nr:RIP metalloprotease RseP [bacterium]
MFTTIGSFIVVLGAVVFVHELGHFLAAKWMGARVEVFSVGFPPKLFGFQRGETEYRLGWVPLGGYVKIAGMIDESFDESTITGEPDEFNSKSTPAKMFIISAGVIMNFILGFIMFSAVSLVDGEREIDPSATVGGVSAEYPAQAAGMEVGDRIINIDGVTIQSWEELTGAVHSRPGDTLVVSWLHGSDTLSSRIVTHIETVPDLDEGGQKEIGLLGISPNVNVTPVNFPQAIVAGGKMTASTISLSLESLGKLITREESIKAVAGPVAIMHFSGETARAGFITFIGFIGFISVSIGLLNIMPFPILDGGHLVYILIEAIIRKPIPTRVKLILQQVGIALILLLVIVVTYNDITRLL